MPYFFIKSLEKLVGLVVILLGIGVVIAAFHLVTTRLAAERAVGQITGGGSSLAGPLLAGLLILVVGAIGVLFVGGFMYLGLGIHQNTKRSAEALEKMANR